MQALTNFPPKIESTMRTVAVAVICLAASQSSGLEVSGASKAESECAACNLIVRNLEAATSGSPIFSELRKDEVIEGMCEGIGDYVGTAKDGVVEYTKPKVGKDGNPVLNLGNTLQINDLESLMSGGRLQEQMQELSGARREAQAKALKSFCALLVEVHEDDISELLSRGSSSLHEDVCVQMVAKCSRDQVQAYLGDKEHPEEHAKPPASESRARSWSSPPAVPKKAGKKKRKKGKTEKKAKSKEEL
jgi:hypothetical protein